MAGTVVTYNSEFRAIERDPITIVFDYIPELGATKSEEIAAITDLPANCKVLCVQSQCIVADSGTTAGAVGLKWGTVGDTPTSFFTGSADSSATVNTIDDGVSSGAFLPNADISAAGDIVVDYDMTGTSTTPPAQWRIWVTLLRTSF